MVPLNVPNVLTVVRILLVPVLVYLTVVVTVLSGADYFFGLRRHVNAPSTRADHGGLVGGGADRRAKA